MKPVRPRAPSKSQHKHYTTEAEFEAQVVDLAAMLGYDLRYHEKDSRKATARGWPDWVLSRQSPPRVVFLELKGFTATGRRGNVSVDQQEWLDRLRECGMDTRVFWPDQSDELIKWLKE